MNASNSTSLRDVNEAWMKVGESVNHAAELYLNELSEYLNLAHDLQREILEQSLLTTEKVSRFGEKQMAFFARLRESIPAMGAVPKGTETVVGMVDRVVQETNRAE